MTTKTHFIQGDSDHVVTLAIGNQNYTVKFLTLYFFAQRLHELKDEKTAVVEKEVKQGMKRYLKNRRMRLKKEQGK